MNKFYAVSILLLLSLSVCANECGRPLGKDFLLETERIVSGYDIGYYRYPWFAVLLHHGSVGCGGALIGPRTVLTAAHCYGDFLTSPQQINLEQIYTIKLGVYNICTPETTETEYKIEKVHVHELYLEKKPYYDISLVILSNDTKDFQSICLPNKAITKRPKEATVPGLGTLRFKGAMPCTVHEARILIYSDNECRAMIHRTGNNGTQLQNAFCAGYLQGGIDTCQGDSGGPLQVITKNGDYFLLGIVSYGFKCALPGLLGVYTDVSQYLNWIETKSGIQPTNSYSNSTNLSKPTHLQPYWKPVNVIIVINDKIMTVRKNVLHRPIASKLNT